MSEGRDRENIDPFIMRRIEHEARELGKRIARDLNPDTAKNKVGFMLMIFSFDGPELTYLSNARREDVVKTMQEFIRRNPPDQTSEARN